MLVKKNDPSKHIMVAGCHSIGALGVIRSLGRAGYIVHAVSASSDAIGFHSNFAQYHETHPLENDSEFASWFETYIRTYRIELIIPGGAISPGGHPIIDKYMHLFPVRNNETVMNMGRKYELFQALLAGPDECIANLPPLISIDFSKDLPSLNDLSKLNCPQFIKIDGDHSKENKGDQVIRLESASETLKCLENLSQHYNKAIVQGFVQGTGVGVFLLRWNNKIKMRFMHRRLHEMPHTGGASSLRESWHHDRILKDAEIKLSYIGWEGVAMVEYRWNPLTDEFYLMEMNLRFWGSIHLSLYAGADFPKSLADSFFGNKETSIEEPRLRLKCRNTIPFEIGYLISLWRDKNVAVSRKLYSIWEMVLLSIDFRVKNDLFFPGDRKVFWYRLKKFLCTGK